MVFERGGAIVHATSIDGVRFTVDPAPLLTPACGESVGAPSRVRTDLGFELYYEARSDVPRIGRAVAGLDMVFERKGTVLVPSEGCKARDGSPAACWDARGVTGPEARMAVSAAGRPSIRLMFGGAGNDALHHISRILRYLLEI